MIAYTCMSIAIPTTSLSISIHYVMLFLLASDCAHGHVATMAMLIAPATVPSLPCPSVKTFFTTWLYLQCCFPLPSPIVGRQHRWCDPSHSRSPMAFAKVLKHLQDLFDLVGFEDDWGTFGWGGYEHGDGLFPYRTGWIPFLWWNSNTWVWVRNKLNINIFFNSRQHTRQ